MAIKSKSGGPNPPPGAAAPPRQVANVPAPVPAVDMNSVLPQSIMEMQKTVSELGAKTDRLITDVSKQSEKLDAVRSQVSFVKGAAWVILGILGVFIALGVAWFNKGATTTAAGITPAPVAQPSTVIVPLR